MLCAASPRQSSPWPHTLLLLLLAGCGNCGAHKDEAPPLARPTEGGVRPVYETTGPVDARAARLCHTLHALPEGRRATCCGSQPGVELTEACAGVLSAALRSQALLLEAPRLEACVAALQGAYQGCDWVGIFGPPLPRECQGLFIGQRHAGEACRSSLECEGTLPCAGIGPTDVGRCAAPAAKPASCSLAVDALASYTRQDVERLHPPCQGLCRVHRCEEAVLDGASCTTSQVCGPGHHCADGRCAAGLAGERQRCWGGDCGTGLRCVNGSCRTPLAEGADCTSDFECRGGCLGSAGSRRCGMRCNVR